MRDIEGVSNIMKKTLATLLLCILPLLLVGIANGGNPAYSMIEYQWIDGATIDGAWTTADEWNDGPPMAMSNNAMFTYNMDFTLYTIQWVVEFFGDTTNDAADYVRICIDPDNGGGSFPQADDRRITIYGDGTIQVVEGGPTWSGDLGQGELVFAQSISASTWESTPHKILELSDPDKQTGIIVTPAPPVGMHVEAYDATTQTLATWPPDSVQDVPEGFGIISDFSQDPIPESFSLAFVAVLSSVAVAASVYFLRKRPKLKEVV
jgi:hypothetical protein